MSQTSRTFSPYHMMGAKGSLYNLLDLSCLSGEKVTRAHCAGSSESIVSILSNIFETRSAFDYDWTLSSPRLSKQSCPVG